MKIGTIASGVGVTTTINLTFVPQFLHFAHATTPSALKVSVLGDGIICDLDAAGIDALAGLRHVSKTTNGKTIQLAEGLIVNRNCEIVITNAVAANIDIFGFSLEDGQFYVQSIRQVALANSGASFENFAFLAVPSMVAADVMNIEFEDISDRRTIEEIKATAAMSQADAANSPVIDNLLGTIKRVNFTPNAQQNVYVVRYLPVGNVRQSIN